MARQSLLSQRGGRLYAEAFPCFPILKAEKQFRLGRRYCQWTNERGRIVGHVYVEAFTAERLVFRSHFLGATNIGKLMAETQIKLGRARRNDEHDRAQMCCPNCGRGCEKIYLVASEWWCNKCHELTTVKRRLNSIALELREREYLKTRLKFGRKKYERLGKYEKLAERYWILYRRHYEAPKPDPEYLFAVHADWYAEEANIKFTTTRSERGYNWSVWKDGGFKRLTWLAQRDGGKLTRSEQRQHERERDLANVRQRLDEALGSLHDDASQPTQVEPTPKPGLGEPDVPEVPAKRKAAFMPLRVVGWKDDPFGETSHLPWPTPDFPDY